MQKKSEEEILRQQLELLAEKSRDTYPASYELSQNSFAMAEISKELFKRKWFAIMCLVAFGYFVLNFAKHGK